MDANKWAKWFPGLLVILLALFFTLLYYTDNKYKTSPPYGRNGVITLIESDVSGNKPLMLVSGWLLSDERVTNQPTYIGEFPNLQRGDSALSPHGKSTYCLTLRYSGEPKEVAISFPQLFSYHIISLDNHMLSRGNGGAKVSFTLTAGDHLLRVQTFSRRGYYSGMYHPPMLANTEILFNAVLIQCIAYGFAFFATLTLALFTIVLWRWAGDKMAFWFGILCCSYSLYLSYFFVRLLNLSLNHNWYLIQSIALYLLCFCVVRLTAMAGGTNNARTYGLIEKLLIISSFVLLLLALLTPSFTWAVRIHGILTDLYYIFTFCSLLLLVLKCRPQNSWEHHFTLLGCTVFGGGLIINLLFSNQFEPILFFWQFEWCGLFLVLLFGTMMAARNKSILAENQSFTNHLEELVNQRTDELTHLLQERKIFFSDMAHDLKAPIFATRGFMRAIRENNTCVDVELLHYIEQVEKKQQEMSQRVQSLITLNNLDSILEPCEPVSVSGLLSEAYNAYHMAAEVMSIHFMVLPPEQEGIIHFQRKKLMVLLENLIFNSLHATPPGGSITLSAELDIEECHLTVADTGGGIPIEEIDHIFERFYVGKRNHGTGSGLGLYIVKSIVDELHGNIDLSSKPGQGTVFYIDLPLVKS